MPDAVYLFYSKTPSLLIFTLFTSEEWLLVLVRIAPMLVVIHWLTVVVPRRLLCSLGCSSPERRRTAACILEQHRRHSVRCPGREQVPARTVFQRRSLRLHRVRLSAYLVYVVPLTRLGLLSEAARFPISLRVSSGRWSTGFSSSFSSSSSSCPRSRGRWPSLTAFSRSSVRSLASAHSGFSRDCKCLFLPSCMSVGTELGCGSLFF